MPDDLKLRTLGNFVIAVKSVNYKQLHNWPLEIKIFWYIMKTSSVESLE